MVRELSIRVNWFLNKSIDILMDISMATTSFQPNFIPFSLRSGRLFIKVNIKVNIQEKDLTSGEPGISFDLLHLARTA